MSHRDPNAGAERRTRPRNRLLDPPRNLLYLALRWAAARFSGVYTLLGLFLSLGLLATTLAMAAFVWLSRRMVAGYTQQLDVSLMQAMERVHTPMLDMAALEVTALGSLVVAALVAAVGSALLLIGASRICLGVHYPSDVQAGFVIGFVWATIRATGIEIIRYFRHRDPRLRQGEKDLERRTPLAPGATNP